MKNTYGETLTHKFVAVDGNEYRIRLNDGELQIKDKNTFGAADKDEVRVVIEGKNSFQPKGYPGTMYREVFENIYTMNQGSRKYIIAMNEAIRDFNEQIEYNKRATEAFKSHIQKEEIKKEKITINEVLGKIPEGENFIPASEIEKYTKMLKEKIEAKMENEKQQCSVTVNIDKVIVSKEEGTSKLFEGLEKLIKSHKN